MVNSSFIIHLPDSIRLNPLHLFCRRQEVFTTHHAFPCFLFLFQLVTNCHRLATFLFKTVFEFVPVFARTFVDYKCLIRFSEIYYRLNNKLNKKNGYYYPPPTAGSIEISSASFTGLLRPLKCLISSPFTYRLTNRLTSPLSSRIRRLKSGPKSSTSLSITPFTVVSPSSIAVSEASVGYIL